eukprot:7683721-Pyramimonas_sp.AAC.1
MVTCLLRSSTGQATTWNRALGQCSSAKTITAKLWAPMATEHMQHRLYTHDHITAMRACVAAAPARAAAVNEDNLQTSVEV